MTNETITTTAQDMANDLSEIYTDASIQSMEHLALVTTAIEWYDVGNLGVSAEDLTAMVCERMLTKPPTGSVTGPIGKLFGATVSKYWGTLDQPNLQDIVDTANLIGRDIFRSGTDDATPVRWATVKRICQGNNQIVERHNNDDPALADVDIMAFFQDVCAAREREKASGAKYRNAKGNQDQTAEIAGAVEAAGYGEHLDEDLKAKAAKARGSVATVTQDPDHAWLVAVDTIKQCCYGQIPVTKAQAFVAEINALAGDLAVFQANQMAPTPVVTTV